MLMFLMLCFTSLAVLAVVCVMFAGLAPQDRAAEARAERPAVAPRFFRESYAPRRRRVRRDRPPVPVEVLLSQIERHVRLEQAAVESFLDVPTTESLHRRTTSPLVN